MTLDYHSGIYCLRSEQILDVSLNEAWDFFSSPDNLDKITPDELSFQITSKDLPPIFPGQIIAYRIGIFPFVRSNWVTEITQVEDKKYFIDEQRFGPYSFWHHLHNFTELDGKTLITDVVHFKLPFGIIGRLSFPLLVKPKLEKIFDYREQKLSELFAN